MGYVEQLEQDVREAQARAARDNANRPEPVEDPTSAKLSAHSAALARREDIRRTQGRDPGPQPGELSDAEMYDLMTDADAFLRAPFEGDSIAFENPENDIIKEAASLLTGGDS